VKATIINEFVQAHGVETVLELGCGDGNQLSLAEYPRYTGLDVSPSAIRLCRERFADDPSKDFYVYDPATFDEEYPDLEAELGLSLEVIFHLVEDDVFERYMTHLFARSRRYVLIYSDDVEIPPAAPQLRRRRFTPWIVEHAPTWHLERFIENPGRLLEVDVGMRSDFFIYARTS
jgi:SAM-dependent methyltransferase